MEYLIDGYNVIKYSEMFYARTLELQRDKLIDFILKYNERDMRKCEISIWYLKERAKGDVSCI